MLVHVDAALAAGHVPIDFADLGADLLSVSGHKFGGPPGAGALLVRRGLRLRPLLRRRRPGAGPPGRPRERAGHRRLRRRRRRPGASGRLEAEAAAAAAPAPTGCSAAARATSTASACYGDPVDRLPHLVCLGVDGIEPQAVLLGLDQAGVAAHSGSACSSESLEPSPVLEAMGVDAHRSLRVSVGWSTTDADIDALLDALPRVIRELRGTWAQAVSAEAAPGCAPPGVGGHVVGHVDPHPQQRRAHGLAQVVGSQRPRAPPPRASCRRT